MRRPRGAPSDVRIAISRIREAPRANAAAATFAHTMSSTKHTTPMSNFKYSDASPTTVSPNDCVVAPKS